MRTIFVLAILAVTVSVANAQSQTHVPMTQASADSSDAVSYYNASGRLLGTVISKIGITTYLMGADGEPLGTFERIDGQRVFKVR